jgi:hypothetical protein
MEIKSIIFSLIFLFVSCEQKTSKNESLVTESSYLKDTINDRTKIVTKINAQTNQTVFSNQQELNNALADQTIDNYYKEIYKKEKLILTNDKKMLSIPEKLFTNSSNNDLFFFIVFTKSLNDSDGFYSESVGLTAFEFVTKKTEHFAYYFNIEPKLNEQDMNNWAEYVFREIQITGENEKKAIKELESQLFKNLKGTKKEYEIIIKKFIEKVKSVKA